MAKLEIVKDSEEIVLIPEILFFNKQNIEWELVEQYLEKYVGEIVEIAETREVVYIGKKFPDEYSGSLYTRKIAGSINPTQRKSILNVFNFSLYFIINCA